MKKSRRVPASRLRAMLSDGQEIAFLDVREEGVFSRGHAFWAVPAPFSHLERRLGLLVPRLGTRIVLTDGDGGELARRAAERISAWGYEDVSMLEGGLQGWHAAGFEVFSGVHVPSKAFGEVIEHRDGTPSIDPAELLAWRAEGRPVVVLDSRPFDEFHRFSLPGGIDCPGAELVHRAFGLVDEATTIVVNCAGRTRSIIGAQSLINAGVPNRVVALRNGTGGWHLAGETLAHGSRAVAPPPTPEGLAQAIEASRRVAERFGVREIDAERLRALQREADRRTLYLFDVRTPEEYEAGHLPGSRHAPGGQLVQSTDFYAGTRGARIVLVDDNGVRARMTASWLRQMGWEEACVLGGGLRGSRSRRGPGRRPRSAATDSRPARASRSASCSGWSMRARRSSSTWPAAFAIAWGTSRGPGSRCARASARPSPSCPRKASCCSRRTMAISPGWPPPMRSRPRPGESCACSPAARGPGQPRACRWPPAPSGSPANPTTSGTAPTTTTISARR